MKDEIREGVEFLRQFLAKYGQLTQLQIGQFATKLSLMLAERYVNHWYVEHPMKGQAFRCLRLKHSESYIDPVLERLLNEMGLHLNKLGLPNDFTLWIDPGEVSVRFGDQVGYTYSIARLNHPIASDPTAEATPAADEASGSDVAKPTLIVQSSEKIFDEKLTAFIRQNSSSTAVVPISTIMPTLDVTEDFTSDLLTDDLIDRLANPLSPEKRTISPPIGVTPLLQKSTIDSSRHQIKRKNSSNIAIGAAQNTKINPIGHNSNLATATSTAPASTINNNDLLLNNLNRLSFNDSCYYSSSSSCASSFGSNYEDNLAANHLGWFMPSGSASNIRQPQQQQQSIINEIPDTSYLLSSMDFDESPTTQSSTSHQNINPFQTMPQPLSLSSSSQSSLLSTINNATPSTNFYQKAQQLANLTDLTHQYMYSDTSSERSDTPNSCMTSSSSMSYYNPMTGPSSKSYLFANHGISSSPYIHQQQQQQQASESYRNNKFLEKFLENPNLANSSSAFAIGGGGGGKLDLSSSSDSTTILSSSDPKLIDISPTVKEKPKSSSKKTSTTEKKSTKPPPSLKLNSPSSSTVNLDTTAGNKEKKDTSGGEKEKEDTYCGYVESFPYYYKLNRLYNALALQKIQAERLRKPGGPNQVAAMAINQNIQFSKNGKQQQQQQQQHQNNVNNLSIGTSPSGFMMSGSSSPPPQALLAAQNALSLGLPQSAPNQSHLHMLKTSPTNSVRINNNNYNSNNKSPMQFKPPGSTGHSPSAHKNGFPMSSTNAAISFANHNHHSQNFGGGLNKSGLNGGKSSSNMSYNNNVPFFTNQQQLQMNSSNINNQFQQLLNSNSFDNFSSLLPSNGLLGLGGTGFNANNSNYNTDNNNNNNNKNNNSFALFHQQQQHHQTNHHNHNNHFHHHHHHHQQQQQQQSFLNSICSQLGATEN